VRGRERETEHTSRHQVSSPCCSALCSAATWLTPTPLSRGVCVFMAAAFQQQEQSRCCDSTVCCCFRLLPAERSRLNAVSGDPQQQAGSLGRHLSKSASDLSTSRRDDLDKDGGRSVLVQSSTTQAHSTSNVPQVAHKAHHSFFSTLKVRENSVSLIVNVTRHDADR
jgi:hypothetical protein